MNDSFVRTQRPVYGVNPGQGRNPAIFSIVVCNDISLLLRVHAYKLLLSDGFDVVVDVVVDVAIVLTTLFHRKPVLLYNSRM